MNYEKINWLNKGEAGAKPINKTNLNKMDEAIAYLFEAVNEALNGTVLYENAEGSNETITLNDSASNYKYVEIYFKTSEHGILGYKKVYNPNNQVTDLTTTLYSSGFIRFDTARVILNAKQLIFKENNYAYAIIANETTTITTNLTILVTRVVGYK